MSAFETLNKIDVNAKTESKQGLTYLSWAWAWAEVKKAYPDATYEITHYDGKPYLADDVLGYMVATTVTIGGESLPMHLPVMNGANKAMKSAGYTYQTKRGEKSVEAATMFDINKSVMRCLVKNLAMFGLGLYIYAGEDLPEGQLDAIAQEWVDGIRAGKFSLDQIDAPEYRKFIESHL
jgi:hypothetical protein